MPERIPSQLQKKFAKIKAEIVGSGYELDTAFVSPAEIKKANSHYRAKDTPTNVLSFPFDNRSGQILICPEVAQKEALKLEVPTEQYLQYLFIHGLLHLIGFDHGATMEHKEQEYCLRFKLKR